MNSKLEALFDEPEKQYLQADELNTLSQFVSSLPERLMLYRRIRDEELTLMQAVADTLEQQFPGESEDRLKRSLQNGILVLRYAAMAMLMDDPTFVTKRLESWLPEMVEAYDTLAIETALYSLMKRHFAGRLNGQQMALLTPGIEAAEALLAPHQTDDDDAVTSESLVGLF